MLGIDVLLFYFWASFLGVQLRLPGPPAEIYYFVIYRLPGGVEGMRREKLDKRISSATRNMLTFHLAGGLCQGQRLGNYKNQSRSRNPHTESHLSPCTRVRARQAIKRLSYPQATHM